MAANYSGKNNIAEGAALFKLFITKSNNSFITNDNDINSLFMRRIIGYAKRSSLL